MTDNSVQDNSIINDIRSSNDFKSITFSGYKKTDVKNQLVENMLKGKIEPACHWCAELLCSGHFIDIWESVLFYLGKHIHAANPKMVVYLEKRYKIFRNILQQGYFVLEIDARNHSTIRKLFAEVVTMLSLSPKKNSFEILKIDRVEEFDITQMSDKLKAPNIDFANLHLLKEDPKELFIVVNELSYHLSSDGKNMLQACFWIEWIIEFDHICRTRKEPIKCNRRTYSVENKFQKDCIWLVWDIFIHYGKKRGSFYESILTSLLELFCIRYTSASPKKRKYLLYFSVEILTEIIDTNIELVNKDKKDVIQNVTEKIDTIYKQIKKNEQSPKTDYLFMGTEAKFNMEQSMRKMELVNSMDILK
jgi:hypothetical protein